MRKAYITRYHLVLEIISYVLLLLSFITAIIGFVSLPEQIPSHFDMAGKVTGYGSKYVLFLMPGVMLATEILISITLHLVKEKYWNVPKAKRPENQILVYRDSASMVVELMVIIAAYNLIFEVVMVVSKGQTVTFVATVVMMGLLLVDIIIRVIRMYRF